MDKNLEQMLAPISEEFLNTFADILIVENLADVSHQIWSHWIKYQFSKCEKDKEGNLIIPKNLVERWETQANTDYEDLCENEKNSDKEQAKKILKALKWKENY